MNSILMDKKEELLKQLEQLETLWKEKCKKEYTFSNYLDKRGHIQNEKIYSYQYSSKMTLLSFVIFLPIACLLLYVVYQYLLHGSELAIYKVILPLSAVVVLLVVFRFFYKKISFGTQNDFDRYDKYNEDLALFLKKSEEIKNKINQNKND